MAMTPEEKAEFNKVTGDLNNAIEQLNALQANYDMLSDLFYRSNLVGKFLLDKDIEVVGNATFKSKRLGFFTKNPVAQPGAISPPAGGATVDAQARTAIGLIITALQNLGLTA